MTQHLASIPTGLDVLLTPVQASSTLGLAIQTLADLRYKGRGPQFVKVGRLVRYRLRDLEAWLDSRTFTHTGEVPTL